MPHVVILGAGVIGLQSAISLLESGYVVTLIAKDLPSDNDSEHYTSIWAGAHWRTHASADPADSKQRYWDIDTYEEWCRALSHPRTIEDRNAAASASYDSYNYWDAGSEPTESIWWAPHVEDFQTISDLHENVLTINNASSAGQIPIAGAAKFISYAIDAPRYLIHLYRKFLLLGGRSLRHEVKPPPGKTSHLAHVVEQLQTMIRGKGKANFDVLINATGIGARSICNDDKIYPIRGQTVLVKGEADAIRTRLGKGYIAYVIPRPGSGTTVLGGTKEIGSWDTTPDEQVTEQILGRCKALAPELLTAGKGVGEGIGNFEVVRPQVGLRPAREGGPRMELEHVNGNDGSYKVVHAYGHAGAGFQNSVGVARDVVQMVDEALGRGKKKARL